MTELAEPFEMSLNAVSKHIRILERTRLVKRRIEGREHFLSFNPKPLDDTLKWMQNQREFWATRLDVLDSLLREEDRKAAMHSKTSIKKKGKHI